MIQMTIETITPDIASEYLKLNKENRTLNNGRIAYYAKMMKNGEWVLNGESLKFNEVGDFVDGQHRLHACIMANTSFNTLVVRNLEQEAFPTLDQGHLRKIGQIFDIAHVPNYNKVSSAINKYLCMKTMRMTSLESHGNVTGAGFCKKFSPKELLDIYNADPDFWRELCKRATVMHRRHQIISVTNIMAIIAHLNKTCGYNFKYVIHFFNQLFFEDMTELGVIHKLRQKLNNDRSDSSKMSNQMKTQLIRKTWDFYKANKDSKIIRWVKGVEEEKPFE